MREAGRVVAVALAAVRREAAVGASLAGLDEVAHEVLRKAGARSPFLNYHPSFAPAPFPAVICASVNDVIVHGIPDGYRLADGDLVSIDFGAELDGWTGDAATSFIVATPRPRAGLAARPGPRQRADADGRGRQPLRRGAGRVGADDGGRHPRGARRAHRRHHHDGPRILTLP